MSKFKESIKTMMYNDIDIQYGQLSICNLGHFCITRNILDKKYQVYSDSANFRFSAVYSNINAAIDKFVLIYNFLKSKEIKN